jgi:hypothetical protein
MTYHSKYLKYKNKYLELKNMIGGVNLNETQVESLWNERNKAGKVYNVTYTELSKFFSEFCFVGPTGNEFGPKVVGLFIYLIKDPKNKPEKGYSFTKKYAVKRLFEKNIGEQKSNDAIEQCQFFNNSYKTTLDLPNIKSGTLYDWSIRADGWVYNTNPQLKCSFTP